MAHSAGLTERKRKSSPATALPSGLCSNTRRNLASLSRSAASACLRLVMSTSTPLCRRAMPAPSRTIRLRPRIQRSSPSGRVMRYSVSKTSAPLLHGFVEVAQDTIAIVGVAQVAGRFDGDRFRCRSESHDAEELCGAAQQSGREVKVPRADAGRFLGQPENLLAVAERRRLLHQFSPPANVTSSVRRTIWPAVRLHRQLTRVRSAPGGSRPGRAGGTPARPESVRRWM